MASALTGVTSRVGKTWTKCPRTDPRAQEPSKAQPLPKRLIVSLLTVVMHSVAFEALEEWTEGGRRCNVRRVLAKQAANVTPYSKVRTVSSGGNVNVTFWYVPRKEWRVKGLFRVYCP